MLINLTDILSTEGKSKELSVSLSSDFFKLDKKQYKIMKNGPVNLVFKNQGKGKAKITGNGEFIFQARCDRCVERTDISILVSVSEEVSEEDILHPSDADEFHYLNGYELDTDMLISNEILINWPVKILCKEDCKGICPKCGKDLNQGDCGCDLFEPDPRMAVIKDIFIANKEV